MATNYYPDTEDSAAPAPAAADTSATDTEQDPESDTENVGKTTVISKSAFGGKSVQPGDKGGWEALHVYDDEVEVKLTHGDERTEEETEPQGMSASDEIDSMAGMPMKGM